MAETSQPAAAGRPASQRRRRRMVAYGLMVLCFAPALAATLAVDRTPAGAALRFCLFAVESQAVPGALDCHCAVDALREAGATDLQFEAQRRVFEAQLTHNPIEISDAAGARALLLDGGPVDQVIADLDSGDLCQAPHADADAVGAPVPSAEPLSAEPSSVAAPSPAAVDPPPTSDPPAPEAPGAEPVPSATVTAQ